MKRFRHGVKGIGIATSDHASTLRAARQSLLAKLHSWLEKANSVLPNAQLDDSDTDEANIEEDLEDADVPQHGPELVALGLPSDAEEDPLCPSDVALCTLEIQLRVGHAYDLLSSARMSVRKKAALISEKERNAHGTKDNLRSQELIKGVQDRTNFIAHAYNANLEKMQLLHGRLTARGHECSLIPPRLRPIDLDKDLRISSLKAARNLGDSKRELPWIFQVAGPHTASAQDQEKWEVESKCGQCANVDSNYDPHSAPCRLVPCLGGQDAY